MNPWSRLWSRRAQAFWREAVIYGSYAARSGLTSLLILGFILGSYAYAKLLQRLPPDYPYWRITTPLLAAAVGFSPFRTFLKPADQVFLLPAEGQLASYWRRSGLYSFAVQAVWCLAALLAVWPLYKHCAGPEAAPFAAVAAAVLVAKAASLDARVFTSRLLHRSHRLTLSAMRGVAAIVFGFMVLTEDYFYGALVFYGVYVLLSIAVKLLPAHRVPWDAWIRTEARQLRVHYTIFSWFADVPHLPARVKPRRFLTGWAGRLPWAQRETYRFLYALSFLRSELAGMAGRIVAVAVFLYAVVDHAVAEGVIYGITLLMATATVSSLDRLHRYSFWPELYPIPRRKRPEAVQRTALTALLAWNTVSAAAFVLLSGNSLAAGSEAVLGYCFILYYVLVPLRRRTAREEL